MTLTMFILSLLYSDTLWARSLKATADKLASETSRIGLSIATFGVILVAIYFMLGRQDASQKATQVLMGLLLLFTAPSLINFMKGLA